MPPFRMQFWGAIFLCMVLGGFPMVGQAQPKRTEKLIWSGQSAGYGIRWTTGDIAAYPSNNPAKIVFSERQRAVKKVAGWPRDPKMEDYCSYSVSIGLNNVVGPYITTEKSVYSYCRGAAHPQLYTTYQVINLNQPKKPMSLTDIFPEQDVLKAMLADKIVREVLEAEDNPAGLPKTLEALVKRLDGQSFEDASGCRYMFDDAPLTHFAFHHLDKNRVAVRIAVSHGNEVCRGLMSQLGLLLPIPEKLQAFLQAAQVKQNGYLMKDAMRTGKGQYARLDLLPEEPLPE